MALGGVPEAIAEKPEVARVVDDHRRALAHQVLGTLDREAVCPLPLLDGESFAAMVEAALAIDLVEADVRGPGVPDDRARQRGLAREGKSAHQVEGAAGYPLTPPRVSPETR